MAFTVGAIVSELQLRKDKWDQSIKKVKDDQQSLSGLVLRNSQQFRQMGMAMTVAGGAIVGAIGLMVKASADFDQSMTESLAIMGDVSDDMREDMAAVARTISTEVVYSAKELAAAYFYLASAGMDVEQSMAALLPVAQFAQAGTFDLAIATDLLTDAQTALGLSSKDALKNQENLIRVSDVLVGANTLANASVKQFAEALTNKAAAALVNVNKEMEEGVAVLAAYADKGIKGQLAGQRLTMMLNGLFDATRRNKKAWDEAGISLFEADGSMRAIADIVQDLEGYLGAMTVKQREAALAMLGFNLRTKDSILTLMGSSEKIRTWTENLKDMRGITKEVADKQLETFNNQLKLLKNTVTDAAIEIGGTLTPALQKLVINIKDVVGGLTDWIKEHPVLTGYIAKSALAVGGLLAVLGPLAMMLPGLVTGFGLLGPAIGGMLGPIGLVTGGLALLATGFVVLFQDALREEKKWLDNSVLVNAALDDMSVSMEATRVAAGLSVKEWKKLRKEYDNNDFALARAIERGEEGLVLQDAQIKSTREIRKAKRAQEETEKALTEATEGLNKKLDKQIKLIETEIPKVQGIRGEITTWGQDIISVTDLVKGLQDSFEEMTTTAIPAARDLSDVLGYALDDLEIRTDKTGKGISINWESVTTDMANYWSNAMAQMVKEGINFTDVLNMSWQTMAVGAGSAVSKVISEVGSLGKLAGPLGALAGSIAGTAISAIGSILGIKSAAQKAAEAAAKAAKDLSFWINNIMTATSKYGEISEATAKKIQEADKSMEGFAAVSKYFADIIKDVGVTQENVNILWERAIGIIENWEQGHLSAGDAAKAANESFKLLLDGVQDLGEEGSAAMVAFILKVRESGLEVKSVTEYVVNQLDRIPEALEGLLAPAVKAGESLDVLKEKLAEQNEELGKLEEEGTEKYSQLREEIEKTKQSIKEMQGSLIEQKTELAGLEEGTEEYMRLESEINNTQVAIYNANQSIDEQIGELQKLGEEGTAEYQKLQEEINRTKDEIEDATVAYEDQKDAVERAGILALAAFNAMIDSGASWTDAVAKMKDPLIALRDQYDALGLDANAALDKLFGIIDVSEAHGELFEAIDANKTILEALGNSGWLTQDALNALATDAGQFYQNLIDAGVEGDTALRMMGPTLQKIKDYAEAYNLKIDDGTQALITQGEELGVVKEKSKEPAEQMANAFNEFKRMFKDELIPGIKGAFSGMGEDFKDIMGGEGGVADRIEQAIKDGFGNAFGQAKTDAGDAATNISDTIGAITPLVGIDFDYQLPDFSNLKGNVNLGFTGGGGKGGEFAGGFQHEGTIEAGPYRPTAFVFGEGSKREIAEIRHTDREGELGGKREVHIGGIHLHLTGVSRSDLERVGEDIKDIVQYQLDRG